MCVTTNNAELFLKPSRFKSHIILVLDRLQCVARVNCLVYINERDIVRNGTAYLKAKRHMVEIRRNLHQQIGIQALGELLTYTLVNTAATNNTHQ